MIMGTTLPGINQLATFQSYSMNKENRHVHPHYYNIAHQLPSPPTSINMNTRESYFDFKQNSTASGGSSPSDFSAPPLLHYTSTPNYSYHQQHHTHQAHPHPHPHQPHHQPHLQPLTPSSIGVSSNGSHQYIPQSGLQSSFTSQPQAMNNHTRPSVTNSVYQPPLVSPLESQSYIRPIKSQSYDANLRLPSIQELVSPVTPSQPQQVLQVQQQQVQPHVFSQHQQLNIHSSFQQQQQQQQPPQPGHHHTSYTYSPTHTIHHISHLQPKKIRKRTRTGCLTCRKRRIKCDERKPFCNNCEKSKKCCAGYVDVTKKKR